MLRSMHILHEQLSYLALSPYLNVHSPSSLQLLTAIKQIKYKIKNKDPNQACQFDLKVDFLRKEFAKQNFQVKSI